MIVSAPKLRDMLVTHGLERWPTDYAVRDQGRLFVRSDYLPSFESRSWTSCESIMRSDSLDVIRTVEQRDNCVVRLQRADGRTVKAYLKRHWTSPGKTPIVKSPGMEEADAVGFCQRAGVPTMSVIAAGHDTRPDGVVESFFMSEQVTQGVPADDFWKRRMGPCSAPLASVEERRSLLAALAETARRFHAANLFHRDFYWCHFFVTEPDSGQFRAHLIDLQRVLQPRFFRWRWLLKDLAQFRFSMPQGHLSADEIRFWFDCYCNGTHSPMLRRLGEKIIAGRAALYGWREQRR